MKTACIAGITALLLTTSSASSFLLHPEWDDLPDTAFVCQNDDVDAKPQVFVFIAYPSYQAIVRIGNQGERELYNLVKFSYNVRQVMNESKNGIDTTASFTELKGPRIHLYWDNGQSNSNNLPGWRLHVLQLDMYPIDVVRVRPIINE